MLLLPLLLVAALGRGAAAQPKTASEWFNVGDNHYNLGEFDKAIEAFRKAFEIEKDDALKPIYLYNIAQAYRQSGDCDNAVFFYKRFLSLKASDTKKPLGQSTKADILKRIDEQEKICADKNNNRDKPPEGTMRPEGDQSASSSGGPAASDGAPGATSSDATRVTVSDPEIDRPTESDGESESGRDLALEAWLGNQPKLISIRVGAGLGVPKMSPVEVANQFSASIIGGYPVRLARNLGIDVGAALGLSPLQWTDSFDDVEQTSLFITAVANVSLRVEVIPRLTLRADLGAGALFFTNVADGNPFTTDGQAASGGALTMFHARIAAAAEFAVAEHFTLWASPITLGYSPAKSGLMAETITQLTFLAGAGYRM
jgi:Tetratricopeptide repeat